jgi:hypothetical protein
MPRLIPLQMLEQGKKRVLHNLLGIAGRQGKTGEVTKQRFPQLVEQSHDVLLNGCAT